MGWETWIRTVEVEPSLYAADFSILGEQIRELLGAGCRVFHFDIGDGHFVEPITMGPIVLQSISGLIRESGGAVDVHMMVEDPAKYFAPIAEAGGGSVTIHFEAVDDVAGVVRAARDHGLEAGIAFTPDSEPEEVAAVAGEADLVLCMAIYPGYSGQPFRPETFDRVGRLRAALPSAVPIQVDGGVGPETIRELRQAGATLLVAGSAIFAHDDISAAYRGLVEMLA
jgi:ribulose-phosphate 3-epimerase